MLSRGSRSLVRQCHRGRLFPAARLVGFTTRKQAEGSSVSIHARHGLGTSRLSRGLCTKPNLSFGAGKVVGQGLRQVAVVSHKLGVTQKVSAVTTQAFDRVGISPDIGNKVLKGTAVVAVGLQTWLLFKKTVTIGLLSVGALVLVQKVAPTASEGGFAAMGRGAALVTTSATSFYKGARESWKEGAA
eukprot:CAMPEP_0205826782 /NCGR_PEP_ID=MMETSP0206-20130828/29831_1 /ASSEMBLY_ACC=CAM_ASM_000279 /TAXON_ID=36767 /ORGANISM="Euplotes focardii, Strain TN1" /LENGTH=186 /DNA_ID=CAMNT_0053127015 /DNA_START=26 /DNA_END=583 /DNA_ORIENTATION=+